MTAEEIKNALQREKYETMYRCARMILYDGCPPDDRMHLCSIGGLQEEVEPDCTLCWANYLDYIYQDRREDPYRFDRIRLGNLE